MTGRSRGARVADVLDHRWLRTLLRRMPSWRGVLVLNYHRVGDSSAQPWDRTLWSATEERFDEQLALLARETDVVGPADLPSAMARGRHVMVTFDDGYRDNYEVAFPLLRRHRLTATFFLATGFLDRPHAAWWDEIAWMVHNAATGRIEPSRWLPAPVELADSDAATAALVRAYKQLPADETGAYLDELAAATGSGRCDPAAVSTLWMTWEMAREMAAGGMTIGGHTVSHPVLARVDRERQADEIDGCARRLEQELGGPMRWFAYPVGSRDAFTETTKRLLRERGVELAFSFYGGVATSARWDALDVPRLHVGPLMDGARLAATVALPRFFARPD